MEIKEICSNIVLMILIAAFLKMTLGRFLFAVTPKMKDRVDILRELRSGILELTTVGKQNNCSLVDVQIKVRQLYRITIANHPSIESFITEEQALNLVRKHF